MAAQALGVLAAGTSRFLVSQYNLIPTSVGITYNLVDMAVSAIASKMFSDPGMGIVASRVFGVMIGVLVTTAVCGPVDLVAAVALNLTSLTVSAITAMATLQRGDELLFV